MSAKHENHFAETADRIGASPSPEQAETLSFIRRYAGEHGRTPTFDEMAAAAHVSKSALYSRVIGLARRGLVSHRPNVARGIALVGRCPCCGSEVPPPRRPQSQRSPETCSAPKNSGRRSRSSAQ